MTMTMIGFGSVLLAMLIAGFSLGFVLSFIALQNLKDADEVGLNIRFYKVDSGD
jgi:hypothetical protein